MNTHTTVTANAETSAKKAPSRKAATKAAPTQAARKAPQKVASPANAKPKTPAPAPAPVEVKTTAPKSAANKSAANKSAANKSAANKSAASPAKPLKDKKVKVVRDSFTIPKSELLQIGESKKRALELGVEIKKSELIRAGLQALTRMNDVTFKKALASVPTIKTGRPAKS